MSIRAHKVIEVKTDEDTSFGLSDDSNFLDACDMNTLDSDCCGLARFNVKKLVKIFIGMSADEQSLHNKLRLDIIKAKKNHETEIEYFLY